MLTNKTTYSNTLNISQGGSTAHSFHSLPNNEPDFSNLTLKAFKCSKLTLEIIGLAVHEDVVDQDHTEDASPQMLVTE